MIQFNLLPDVKLQHIKAVRQKRVVIAISSIAAIASLALLITLLLIVQVAQKRHISALDKDIDSSVTELKKTEDLDKILTVQNQLNSLPGLHDKKVVASRTSDYLGQLTPKQATISDIDINFEENKIKIEGNANALNTVNKFIDTMKATTFVTNGNDSKNGQAFSNIVLESFKIEDQTNVSAANGGPIAYSIIANFDSAIFSNIKEVPTGKLPVELKVPTTASSNSTNKLFAPQAEQQRQTLEGQQNQAAPQGQRR